MQKLLWSIQSFNEIIYTINRYEGTLADIFKKYFASNNILNENKNFILKVNKCASNKQIFKIQLWNIWITFKLLFKKIQKCEKVEIISIGSKKNEPDFL